VLVAQIPFTKKENKNIFFEYGVRGQALVLVPPRDDKDVVTFDGKWSIHKLKSFFSQHALKEEVSPVKAEEKKDQEREQATEEKVKTEL
jgi:hypothetical protein